MASNTANFGFRKPTVGGDDDAWGFDYSGLPRDVKGENSPGLNGNWELLDQEFIENEALLAALEAEVATIPTDLDALYIQVDDLYVSATDDDPATTLGYGTWEQWGRGRALVGVGNNGQSQWDVNDERGFRWHTLTEGEMPPHTHNVDFANTSSTGAGAHSHTYDSTQSVGGTGRGGSSGAAGRTINSGFAGGHAHTLDIGPFNSNNAGSGSAHINEQPGTAVYIWKRLT
jgi:microcystin-dependent protein